MLKLLQVDGCRLQVTGCGFKHPRNEIHDTGSAVFFQLHLAPHGSQGTAIAAWACIAVGISSPCTATHGRMHARTPSTPAWLGLGLGVGLGLGLGLGLG